MHISFTCGTNTIILPTTTLHPKRNLLRVMFIFKANQQSVMVIICCEDLYEKWRNANKTNVVTAGYPLTFPFILQKNSEVRNPFFAECLLVRGESNE